MKEIPAFDWDTEWKEFKSLNFFGRKLYNDIEKAIKAFLEKNSLPKNIIILDFGCGKGTTLNIFRKLGYINSIGVDESKHALDLCNKLYGLKLGRDVFRPSKIQKQKFDIVLADGLMELYSNLDGIAKQISSKSKKYLILIEPNRFSMMHRLKNFLGKSTRMYSHSLDEIEKTFSKLGFKINQVKNCNFNEHWVIFLKSD